MKLATIKKLNSLNQKFYQETAEHFNDSRQFYWAGWEKLLPKFKKQFSNQQKITVLDLGCGNGRFGSFLTENLEHKINYHGFDSNPELLKLAEKRSEKFSFSHTDLVNDLLENHFLQNFPKNSPSLIVMFGVWHHLPSSKLRHQLLQETAELLNKDGLLIFTVWKFHEHERFKKKIIPPEKVGLKPASLENNDYILDWKRGTKAYRYCHYSTDKEIQELLSSLPTLKKLATFRADGEQNRSNKYYVLEKIS